MIPKHSSTTHAHDLPKVETSEATQKPLSPSLHRLYMINHDTFMTCNHNYIIWLVCQQSSRSGSWGQHHSTSTWRYQRYQAMPCNDAGTRQNKIKQLITSKHKVKITSSYIIIIIVVVVVVIIAIIIITVQPDTNILYAEQQSIVQTLKTQEARPLWLQDAPLWNHQRRLRAWSCNHSICSYMFSDCSP